MNNNLEKNEQQLFNSNSGNYPNNSINQNYHAISLIKSCKSSSIAYIVIWLLEIIFAVVAIILFSNFVKSSQLNHHYNGATEIVVQILVFYLCLGAAIILGIVLFILGIALITKTSSLKNYYPNNKVLWVWFLIGLFIFGIFSFIGSIITISFCNKIESNISSTYNQSKSRY